jgi:Tropinone reductase 1
VRPTESLSSDQSTALHFTSSNIAGNSTQSFGYPSRRAIVEELASLGASVYTCARSSEDLDAAITDWKGRGLDVSGIACDISKSEGRQALLQGIEAAFKGKLDILVSSSIKRCSFVTPDERCPSCFYLQTDSSHVAAGVGSRPGVSRIAHPLSCQNCSWKVLLKNL